MWIDTVEKHSLWELEVEHFERPVLASELIDLMGSDTSDADISQSILKSFIAKSFSENGVYAKCSICKCPVHFIAKNATAEAHFRHIPTRAPSIEKMKVCSFYSDSESFFGKGQIYKGEGQWHFKTKHFLASHLDAIGCKDVRVEKFIFSKDPEIDKRRRPDISFMDVNGNRFVIELTRWWMNPEVVYEREKFFRTEGYNLLWLFSPNCEETNLVTLNLILYGSPASRQTASINALLKVECNAFVLSDEAIERMETHRNVTFEVLYPVPTYDPTLKTMDIVKHSQWVQLEDLNLAPRKRLPFAVNTSVAFKRALDEKRIDDRQALARDILILRKFARAESIFESETGYKEALKQIGSVIIAQDNECVAERLDDYKKRAKKNIEAAYTNFVTRQARKDAAEKIRFVRQTIREHLLGIERIQFEDGVQAHYNRIKNVAREVEQYGDSKIGSFINRALSRVECRLEALKSHRTGLAQAKHDAKQKSLNNHINEREAFIAELKKGFSDIPEDVSVIELKKNRIVRKAVEFGFRDRAAELEHAFDLAIDNAFTTYKQTYYPNLSHGWSSSPSRKYKMELDSAFSLCAENLHKRDPRKKRVESYQRATRKVLSDFQADLISHVERFYQELHDMEQPSLYPWFKKNGEGIKRMRACLAHMELHGYRSDKVVHLKLDIVYELVDQYYRGSDARTIKNIFYDASLRCFGSD
ncbi:hypothetical protein [Vibrio pectenicida]|uniref:Competence protein CoiA nuclease-like domain-containing protein n=1 Tax=Vibrio pectenicida TaxID=62763 RepID=A0A3R9FN84_9VIBR|nr:hypothetical protein [Vibrio pectenicida]RSD30400.1 hypothetical protein EJA03_14165 [Vibrio pectenicida]